MVLTVRQIHCKRFSRPFTHPPLPVHVLRLRGRQRAAQHGSAGVSGRCVSVVCRWGGAWHVVGVVAPLSLLGVDSPVTVFFPLS